MKKKLICIGILLIVMVIISFFFYTNVLKKKKEKVVSDDVIEMNMKIDDSDEEIDWSNYPTKDITLNESLEIKEEGTYNLTGTIEDGNILIDVKGNVRLLLDNVTIKNSKGPAIYVKEAEDVVIVTSKDSSNYLEDGTNYSNYEEEVTGVIYSSDDITFDGEGILKIKSNKADAIVGKDDLKIINGIYEIDSQDDGIKGRDSVYIKNGNFSIAALGDGIKSTNDKDSDKGFVLIESGRFSINSNFDGIQAETNLLIKDGSFKITTGDGSESNESKAVLNEESKKGIKASTNLIIENGNFMIDSKDDAIHSNNSIKIIDGEFTILSGDDGIHADKELMIEDGTVDIQKSYEGLEASKITIRNGNIKVVSDDDGINVAGGNDSSSMNRPGANKFHQDTENILTIDNGIIYINSKGDGLDANGSIYMNNGFVQVDGPSDSGNGALDYDIEFVVNGGTLIAGGDSGMAQEVSESSIYNISIYFENTYNQNDVISIVNSEGKEIISYQSSKSFSSLIIASSNLQKGDYQLLINDKEYTTFTIADKKTVIGNSRNFEDGRPGGNRIDREPNMAGRPDRPIKRK